jgi:hypothetical protein
MLNLMLEKTNNVELKVYSIDMLYPFAAKLDGFNTEHNTSKYKRIIVGSGG